MEILGKTAEEGTSEQVGKQNNQGKEKLGLLFPYLTTL